MSKPAPMFENKDAPKLIIDEQLARGLGEQLIEALAKYFKIAAEAITVSNDDTSPEHTLVKLHQVRRSDPRIKLRLQELQRHERTYVYYQSDADVTDIDLRIEDAAIVEVADRILKK